MPDPDNKRERSPAVVIAAIVMLVLAALYVLSVGPAYWISTDRYGAFRSDNHRDAFCAVYSPIIVPYQRGPRIVRVAIGSYLRLFEKG